MMQMKENYLMEMINESIRKISTKKKMISTLRLIINLEQLARQERPSR